MTVEIAPLQGVEDRTSLAWPSQIHYSDNGIEYSVPCREEYRLGDRRLPVSSFREHITDTIAKRQVTIVKSPTGSGKSTAIPLFLMEDARNEGHIYMTQPRIIATREVRSRMVNVTTENLGEDTSDMIGYMTGVEGESSDDDRVTVVTDGLLLEYLLDDKVQHGDTIVIDEFHERSAAADYCASIALMRGVKLVFMSATIDTEELERHAGMIVGEDNVSVIDVPGSMYAVEEREGGEMSDEIIRYAHECRNIQVFIDGRKAAANIESMIRGKIPNGYTILYLNGDQTPEEQRRCLDSYPGGKIILSTPAGQTSLTIPDLDVVIDGGWQRSGHFVDGTKCLPIERCSFAEMLQRKGRIGRTHEGIYVYAHQDGYPPDEYMPDGSPARRNYIIPEIQRKDPADAELRLRRGGLSHESIKEYLLDMPPERELDHAVRRLKSLGSLGVELAEMTVRGERMASLSLDVDYAAMVVEAGVFGPDVQCMMMAAMAAQQVQGITSTATDELASWQRLCGVENRSDILNQLDVFIEAMKMTRTERVKRHILEQRYQKALVGFKKLAEEVGYDVDSLTHPNDIQRRQLIQAIAAGSSEFFVKTGHGRYRDRYGRSRQLPNSSMIPDSARLLAGRSFDMGHMGKESTRTNHLITAATIVDPELVIRVAPHRVQAETKRVLINESGEVVAQQEIWIDGQSTRQTKSIAMEASIHTTEMLMAHLMHSGARSYDRWQAVDEVTTAFDALYDLQHRTALDLDLHNRLYDYTTSVMNKVGAINNITALAKRLHPNDIYDLVPREMAREIYRSAPDTISLGEDKEECQVHYVDNRAYVTVPVHLRAYLDSLSSSLGGREIMVRPNRHTRYETVEEAVERYSATPRSERRKKSGSHDNRDWRERGRGRGRRPFYVERDSSARMRDPQRKRR